ncbi:non-ribosomal peptide synthetase [Hyphomonas pacifica]|uniref:non-ribosomal peptide synthetase n=1 Tax=Hyphomonas pacifica TaxID=1280941 RepID=UPI000DC002B7|nr:non-ribosomal peptide synthetase [Hyphomonas pacifica]RAN35588.1 hypothetical protein HY11_13495 [Hyphomonas pacifica]
MDIDQFIQDLAKRDVTLWASDDKIRFRGPKGALRDSDKTVLRNNQTAILAALQAREVTRDIPLSDGQRSLWFVYWQAPLNSAYNLSVAWRVKGRMEPAVLEQAFQKVLERHAPLRACFPVVAGNPVQRIPRSRKVRLKHYRVEHCSEQEVLDQVKQVHKRPFNLVDGPVCRLALFRVAENDHIILFEAHHIVCDATASAVACHDLKQFYNDLMGGLDTQMSSKQATYPDYVATQRAELSGPRGKALIAHWRDVLKAPLPIMELPTDRPRPVNRTFRGSTIQRTLSPELASKLDKTIKDMHTTRPTVLMATYAVLLGQLADLDDVIIGSPFLGRTEECFSHTVGHFANPLPIRFTLTPGKRFLRLVEETRDRMLDALDHQDMPLMRLVDTLNPPRVSSHMPFFDVLFTYIQYEHVLGPSKEMPFTGAEEGCSEESYPIPQMEGQFDLSLRFEDTGSDLVVYWGYDTDLYDRATVEAMAERFEAILSDFVTDCARPIDAFQPASSLQAASDNSQESEMDVNTLFGRLADRGVTLSLDGDQLRINAPKGAIDGPLRNELVAMKPAIMAALQSDASGQAGDLDHKTGLPLSFAQQRLWFLSRLDPMSTAFNVGSAAWIDGPLQPAKIITAFTHLAKRHDALRMRFKEVEGNPVAEIVDTLLPSYEYIDLAHVAPEDQESEVQRIIDQRLQQPFDLGTGPLATFTLIRVNDTRHATLFMAHHIIVDGWSLALAHREVVDIYDALVEGREPDLPPVSGQATDHARRERRMAVSTEWKAHVDFWREELRGAPAVIDLPTDRRRPANQTYKGARLIERFDAQMFDQLNSLARSQGVTLFMLLMAGWAATLYRYSGQSDIVLGSPHANRNGADQEGMIGCLINNMVLRCRINGELSFSDYLKEIRLTTLGSLEHSELPFDLLVDTVNPERSASHAPIFQALFSLMSFPKIEHGFKDTEVEAIPSGTGASRYDLSLDCVDFGGELLTQYEYSTDLFDAATIERLHSHYKMLLQSAIADPSVPVNALQMLTADDRASIADANTRTVREFDRSATALDMIEACARDYADQGAITDAAETLSYADMDRRANQLANLLRTQGIDKGSLVAVSLGRSAMLPVALLAVWKAGGAYLPLDPKHPEERVNGIVSDAGVDLILTDTSVVGQFSAQPSVLSLDAAAEQIASMSQTAPARTTAPEDVAYVIYTSGSTGRPKGVEVEHRNLAAFLVAMRDEPGIKPGQTLLSVTTPSFDIFGLEAWLPLSSGARMVVAARETALDGRALAALMDSEGVDILQATPATWNVLIETGWKGREGMKALCGGESLPHALAEGLVQRVGEVWNMYGPTETTIWSTVQRITKADDAASIGKPIANTRTYILDDQGNPVPPGAIGELCIGGEGVARGYRGRQDLTDERYMTLNLPGHDEERIYRTGDFARETADGRLIYLGRRDFQVKIRGFRIELGEIESELGAIEGIAECAVVAHERAPGDHHLVAYVVPSQGRTIDSGLIRAALREKLPNYMVPSYVVAMDTFPLTPNLKVDRKALPAPQEEQAPAPTANDIIMSPAERSVADIWRGILGVSHIGLNDNFFDIGGHSMLMVRLHERLRSELGANIALIELFQRTTVAQQATVIPRNDGVKTAPGKPEQPILVAKSDRLSRAKERAERLRHG